MRKTLRGSKPEEENEDTLKIDLESQDFLFSPGVQTLSAKVIFMESALSLVTKDIRFSDFIRELLLAFMKAVKCESGSILEVDHKMKSVFFRAAVGNVSDKVVNFVIPLGQGVVGHVIESRQPLVVSDVAENRYHLDAITKTLGYAPRNMIALPLIVRGQVYGVVELLNRVGSDHFTEADLELLTTFCEIASKVIEVRMMIVWAKKSESEAA